MEEPDHPKARRVCPVTVLPCVGPDQPVTSTSGQAVNAWPCWQTSSSSPVGVDPHKDPHTAAVVQAVSGAMLEQVTIAATPAGSQQLLRLANRHDGRRVWAIEAPAATVLA
jgi:hypothetical protein